MKKNSRLLQCIFLTLAIAFLLNSCVSQKKVVVDKDFEKMKAELFKRNDFGYIIPIYADPPTEDYNEFKDNKFPFQVTKDKIKLLDKYRDKLKPFIMKNIDENDSWVYLATYFKYKELVPVLKKKIVSCDKFYGWEGPDYSKVETFLNEAMYPHQNAYIEAIKYITQKSIKESLNLSEKELKIIKSKAKLCVVTNKDTMETSCCNKRLIETVLR